MGQTSRGEKSLSLQQIVHELHSKLSSIKHVIAVLSSKGGVGKSVIASSIAIYAAINGKKVAIFDADMHGSSIPWLIGLRNAFAAITIDGIIKPVERDTIAVLSIELFLKEKNAPVVWRGPLKTRTILDFLSRTEWGERDLMVIDLPPGTGDEALTIAQTLKDRINGVVLVLTPGLMVSHVVTKAYEFLKMLNLPLLGTVLNMAYFRCPHCGNVYRVLGSRPQIPNEGPLIEIPLDPKLAEAVDSGQLYEFLEASESEGAQKLREMAHIILSRLGV